MANCTYCGCMVFSVEYINPFFKTYYCVKCGRKRKSLSFKLIRDRIRGINSK